MSVEFKAANHDLLEKAITELGYRVTSNTANEIIFYANGTYVSVGGGKIRLDKGMEHIIDQLKREYTKQAVKKAASRYGWASKETAQGKLTLTRR